MLIVKAINKFTHPDDVADYEVHVFINQTPIWNGYVTHDRTNRAEGLLRVIADVMEKERKIA